MKGLTGHSGLTAHVPPFLCVVGLAHGCCSSFYVQVIRELEYSREESELHLAKVRDMPHKPQRVFTLMLFSWDVLYITLSNCRRQSLVVVVKHELGSEMKGGDCCRSTVRGCFRGRWVDDGDVALNKNLKHADLRRRCRKLQVFLDSLRTLPIQPKSLCRRE